MSISLQFGAKTYADLTPAQRRIVADAIAAEIASEASRLFSGRMNQLIEQAMQEGVPAQTYNLPGTGRLAESTFRAPCAVPANKELTHWRIDRWLVERPGRIPAGGSTS